ncbi:MAG: fluoride efflux transporter FluC [Wenzhouxiangella sp.]
MADSLLHPLTLLAVLCGAAVGGVLRHAVSRLVMRGAHQQLPWGTLVVNVSGAGLVGLMAGVLLGADLAAPGLLWQLFVVGLLGSYTTVSALSLQTLELVHERKTGLALRYLLLTLGLGLPATVCGLWLGRAIVG